MQTQPATIICFSPTGTTRRVLSAVASGLGADHPAVIDLTAPGVEQAPVVTLDQGVAIIGVPVYAGRTPLVAKRRLQRVRGAGIPAILVVTYGNRAIDDALLELSDTVRALGFLPAAGAAFIGEHSFATEETPIAAGRPDNRDLAVAQDFGQRMRKKIEQAQTPQELETPTFPGKRPYRELKERPSIAPAIDVELCVGCGACAEACPVGAIEASETDVATDAELCTWCCACTRACPEQARSMTQEPVPRIRRWLWEEFRPRQEPTLFGVESI